MQFTRNLEMELMTLDDGDNVVFDPATGDTHFLDSVGADILRLIKTPKDMDVLVKELALEYDADIDTITADITPFLEELCQKGVIKKI